MESINDNITEEILLNEINEILTLPMYKERILQEQRKMGQRKE
jgi:mRNA-capping enzyme